MARKKLVLRDEIANINNYLQVLTLRIEKLEQKYDRE